MKLYLVSREPEIVYDVDGMYYPHYIQCKQWYVEGESLPKDGDNFHIILRDDGQLCSCIEYDVEGDVEYIDLTDEEVVEIRDWLAEQGINTDGWDWEWGSEDEN